MVAGQRVDGRGVVGDPVGVPAPDRREAGVEPVGGGDHAAYADVGGQETVEPAAQVVDVRLDVDVGVGDLTAGVHAGVGAAGAGHGDLGDPEDRW